MKSLLLTLLTFISTAYSGHYKPLYDLNELDPNNPIPQAHRTSTNEKSFVFVVPSYNNSEWYEYNLDSIFAQDYPHFRVIYVDDNSPDGTGELVRAYVEKKGWSDKVTLICNTERVGALANLYRAIHLANPTEIVVNLDGDDWLPHKNVLNRLNQAYKDPNVWLTYSQFIYWPSYEMGIGVEIPREVMENNEFR
ncbi:MAG: glycosyltransferase family A protein, partial [Chlamydiota bacterium]